MKGNIEREKIFLGKKPAVGGNQVESQIQGDI